jgi:hypothetical protein
MFYRCELWQNHVSAGCYPDCDMLPLGYLGKGFGEERQTNLTAEEQKTMMTLWCLFGSPLMLGAELTKLDEETLSLITNRRILNMLTPDCRPRQLCRDDAKAIWRADNEKSGEHYVALFNLSDGEAEVSVSADSLEIGQSKVKLTEGWSGKELELSGDKLSAVLPAHGCAVYEYH